MKSQEQLDPRIAEAIRLFEETPGHVVSMPEVARNLGWSRPHFDREFTRQVGHPPKRFLLKCKMRRARKLLEESRMSIGEIADTLMYEDIYFFSRQFKRFCGLAPSVYRRRATKWPGRMGARSSSCLG
jgi:transcriptional regulator GlxA family with amidase domain